MSPRVANPFEPVTPDHVDDGDLLRMMDAEVAGEEHDRIASHLSSCGECARRRDALVAISGKLHAASEAVTLPAALATPPWRQISEGRRLHVTDERTSRSRPAARRVLGAGTRAAAALVLLAAGAAAAVPIRAWWAGRDAEQVRRAPASAVGSSAAQQTKTASAPSSHTAALDFVPTGRTLTIEVDAATGDSIVLRSTVGTTVHVGARTTAGEPTLVVMPDRVRLVSERAGATVFAVEVPASVRMVEVRAGTRSLVTVGRAALETAGGWRGVVP